MSPGLDICNGQLHEETSHFVLRLLTLTFSRWHYPQSSCRTTHSSLGSVATQDDNFPSLYSQIRCLSSYTPCSLQFLLSYSFPAIIIRFFNILFVSFYVTSVSFPLHLIQSHFFIHLISFCSLLYVCSYIIFSPYFLYPFLTFRCLPLRTFTLPLFSTPIIALLLSTINSAWHK